MPFTPVPAGAGSGAAQSRSLSLNGESTVTVRVTARSSNDGGGMSACGVRQSYTAPGSQMWRRNSHPPRLSSNSCCLIMECGNREHPGRAGRALTGQHVRSARLGSLTVSLLPYHAVFLTPPKRQSVPRLRTFWGEGQFRPRSIEVSPPDRGPSTRACAARAAPPGPSGRHVRPLGMGGQDHMGGRDPVHRRPAASQH